MGRNEAAHGGVSMRNTRDHGEAAMGNCLLGADHGEASMRNTHDHGEAFVEIRAEKHTWKVAYGGNAYERRLWGVHSWRSCPWRGVHEERVRKNTHGKLPMEEMLMSVAYGRCTLVHGEPVMGNCL